MFDKNRLAPRGDVLSFGTVYSVYTFYRAMHFSAKRGIAIACRLSVCL